MYYYVGTCMVIIVGRCTIIVSRCTIIVGRCTIIVGRSKWQQVAESLLLLDI